MSSPLATLDQFEPDAANWEPNNVVALLSSSSPLAHGFTPPALTAAIASFKYTDDNRDHKFIDYLLLGILSVLVHTSVIDHFKGISFTQEIVEPIKPPPKVQITLSRPQPKPVAPPPPPQVQPKPPVQKAVPLKPPKPRPVPKVVEQAPAPEPTPVVNSAPAAPGPAAPAPPAPVVEEKITEPTANAAYLHNPLPEYPEFAQERGWEGKVIMKVHVLPDGTTDSVTVVKSSGQKVLDDAAVKAVYKWSFVPAKRGDTPIARYTNVPFTFKL